MRTYLCTLILALAPLSGCGAGDSDSDGNSGSATKADDVESDGDPDALECDLDSSEPRELVQFVNNNTIQYRCHGGGHFVDTACCADEIEDYTLATGCPLQAKFNSASGADKRCVEDQPDDSDDIGAEALVPTQCCALLCDEGAKWDDLTVKNRCRDSGGRFHPHVCCTMNEQNQCDGASFDENPDVNGFRHCRATSSQYALAACCIDACFDIIAAGELVPLECLLPAEEECAGAAIDSNNLCRADDGRFAKGACCLGIEGLDHQRSDECRTFELMGDDLQEAGCL